MMKRFLSDSCDFVFHFRAQKSQNSSLSPRTCRYSYGVFLHRCFAHFLVFSRLDKVNLLIATCQLLHNEFYLHLSMSRFNQVHFYLFIYLFIFGCSGSSLLLSLLSNCRVGATLQLQCMSFSLWRPVGERRPRACEPR